MLKRSVKYAVIALILVVAMLLQPWWPNLRLTALAQGTPVCSQIFLPLILRSSLISTSIANPMATFAPASRVIPPPTFGIISPREGWTISGMMFFAAQPIVAASVSSVTFSAGSTTLGTDATPEDGFKAFFNAGEFPAGPLQLTAFASGPCGETTKSITVNVVPDPPSSGTVGPQGGVFASPIGSIITIPPGGAPAGTAVTVAEKTQEQVTADNGIDWEALGVTFLGAQEVQASAPISSPLMVASAGFGNRVQPGQAVVAYRIFPDADGDGVDELVVVNSASVAPNDDVISDPVLQTQIRSAIVQPSSDSFSLQDINSGISGPPGTIIEVNATGFNPFSALGNVAVYRSLVDGTEFRVPLAIIPDPEINSNQTLRTMIPSLPPGPGTLVLLNESTGSSVGPLDVTVKESSPLSRPAEEIIDEFLVLASDFLNDYANDIASEDAFSPTIESFNAAINGINESRLLIQQMSSEPELRELLDDIAIMIVNSSISDSLSSDILSAASFCDNWPLLGLGAATATTLGIGFISWGQGAAAAATAATGAGAVKAALAASALWTGLGAILLLVALAVIAAIIIECWDYKPEPNQSNSGSGTLGMGSAPPPGGNGAGNAPAPPPGGAASSLSIQSGFLDQQAGRVAVKVKSSGSLTPFTGVTDPGGYFFVPFIPEGEPFTATAIDTLTGQFRSFEGVGPATGESVFMFFDFFSDDVALGTIAWDGGGDGTSWHDPLNWNLDRLPAPTDTVTIDVPGDITVTHSQGDTSIVSLHSEEAIVLSGGSLSINAVSEINNTFTMSLPPLVSRAITLSGAGDLTVNGLFTWTEGSVDGSGRIIANGGLVIGGNAHKFFSGRTLDNAGTATWSGNGAIVMESGAVFNNLPGGTFEVQTDSNISGGSFCGPAAFNNMGSLIKSVGSSGDPTIIGTCVDFTNDGSLNVLAGELDVTLEPGGTSSGSFNVAAGAKLAVYPRIAHTLEASSTVAGAGDVRVTGGSGGTLNVAGTYAVTGATDVDATVNFARDTIVPALTLTSFGTLTGTGTLTVTNALTWAGGTMDGLGHTIASGTLTISGSSSKLIRSRTLNNAGTAIWSGSASIVMQGGAIFNNLPGATFDVQKDGLLLAGLGSNTFNNAGTFAKSTGVGTMAISPIFNNSGTVQVLTGTLSLRGGGTSSGALDVPAGATLDFRGGTHTLDSNSSVTGAGVVSFASGTVNLLGSYTITGNTQVSGGTANFNPGATIGDVGNPLTISGGTANFSSGDTITTTNLVLSGGTLTGSSDVTVSDVLTWTRGTMSGAAQTIANGTLEIGGTFSKILDTRTLENRGAATWSGTGPIAGRNGATLSNPAAATLAIIGDASFQHSFGTRPTFANAGSVTKSAGSGISTIQASFDNSGTVTVGSGTLSLDGGGAASGAFEAQSGAILRFAGSSQTYNLDATSSVTGAGTVRISRGIVNILGDYSVTGTTELDSAGTANFAVDTTLGDLTLSAGTITGSGTLTANGLFIWTGGSMSGTGHTVANGGLEINGLGILSLTGRTLDNAGTAVWIGGSPSLTGGAVFNNLPGATFDAQGNSSFLGGGGGIFNNGGTLVKSGGTGTSSLGGLTLNNSGTVEVQTGILNMGVGLTQTAGTTLLNGGDLTVAGLATLDFQGGTLAGSGTINASVINAAQVQPGGIGASGVLTITRAYNQAATGLLNVELGGLNPATEHDQLVVGEGATLDGTLDVSLINGFSPGTGDSFQVMTYGSRTGTFATINGNGQTYTPNYNANDLTLVAP